MSQQGFSIGRDVTLVVVLPTGLTLRLDKVTGWTAKQDTSDQKIKGLDGSIDHLRWYEGWTGSFKIERRSSIIDDYFAQLEANYYADIDEPPAFIQQTIKEPNGVVTQYRFEKVLLKYDDAGDWASDKSISQTVSFMASKRIKQL